jgi:hypothetical protein
LKKNPEYTLKERQMKRRAVKLGVLFALILAVSISLAIAIPVLAIPLPVDTYVAMTGNDSTGDGTSGNPWQTIQYAINHAATGYTIHVAVGTYPGALNLGGKSLTMTGAGIDTTIIDASTATSHAIQGFGNGSSVSNLTLMGSSVHNLQTYGFKVSQVSNFSLTNVKVVNSWKTAIDLNTVNGATLNNIEARDTGAGFGLMILDSTNINVNNVTTNNNSWGGVSVQTKNAITNNINFSGVFNVQESLALLLEKDPPTYYAITNVTIPAQFTHAVYALRSDNYKQWFYLESLDNAKAFAAALKASTVPFTYSGLAISNTAETNYFVNPNLSIQDAINAATNGDTINIEAGTYNEAIDVAKRITLQGTGNTTILQNRTGSAVVGGYRPVVLVSANGTSESYIQLKNLLIQPNVGLAGASQPGIFIRPNNTVEYLELNNVHIIGSQPVGTGETGLLVENTSSLNHLIITSCLFEDMAYGINFQKTTATYYQNNVRYVTISDTTLNNNSIKGFYAEKLSDATFNNVRVTNNSDVTLAPDWTAPWNAGIDINLKYGDYQNLVFNNLTVDGNGMGHVYGTGLVIKARGTGTDAYGDVWGGTHYGATLVNVQISGGTFTNNVIAIRFGDAGKNNTGPTNITITDVSISKTNQSGMVNLLSGVTINAIDNYWGSANGPTHNGNTYNITDQGSSSNGTINYTPWLKTAGGTSFAPVTNGGSSYASIQAAINAATNSDTIIVKPGIFTEAIVINKQLTLHGATWNVNKNGYTVPAGYSWDNTVESIIVHPNPAVAYNAIVDIVDIDNVTFQGFVVQELNAVTGNNFNSSLVRVYAYTRAINNIIVENNVIGPNTNTTSQDGTQGRMGLYIINHPYSNQYGVVNSTFSGNKIFDCKGNGNNVFIWSSYASPPYNAPGPASMSGTVINDNEIYGAHRSGIETAGGYTGLKIQNNKIYNNGGVTMPDKPDIMYGNGIVLIRASGDSHSVTIPGLGPKDLIIQNNEIYNNQRNGIYMGPISQNITLTNNKIYNDGQDGVRVDLAESYNNPDFEEGDRIPWDNKTENIVAHLNRIYDNTGLGVRVIGTPTNGFIFNATNNWWGTANGATIATKVSGAVTYDPWHLKAPTPLAVGETTTNSIVLNWTIGGVWGGEYYDFRYATTPINTAANWNNATRITGEPTPINGAQTMMIRGLSSITDYYFAYRIADNYGRSDMSQNHANTLVEVFADNTAPNPITNLAVIAGAPSTTSVILTWTATGDDGATGLATKYIIKRSVNPIDATNFDAATTVYNDLTPKANGEGETLTISKLSPNTTYFFAIKVQDEVPNTSPISNIVNRQTANLLPTVTGITPGTGDNEQARTLTIDGTNFAGAGINVVRLVNNDNVITLTNVATVSNTQLTAVVPKGAPTGTYQCKVINDNGTSDLSASTYIVTVAPTPLPFVTNAIPNMAASNTPVNNVEIFGNNFNGATAVTINGHAATIISVTATKIVANVPGMAAGEYDIKVTTPDGANDVSAVKYIVTDPVVISQNSSQDTTTSSVVSLNGTNVIPVQLTLTTDNSENATQNTDDDAEIEVVIPPNTAVTDNNGNAYTGTLNPPRVVKPDTTIQTDLPGDAIVIEMGNPDQTINFNQDFVATVRVNATTVPDIYYLNKTTGKYELSGKSGTKDGITYEPGGTVLGFEDGVYTIGLLLDHMSVYVSSTITLIPIPTPHPTPTPVIGSGGGGTFPQPPQTSGTTNIRGSVTSTGRFSVPVTAISADKLCKVDISANTTGLDKDLKPLTEITIYPVEHLPSLPNDWRVIGLAYDLGPSGASFDPAITLTFTFDPTDLPENTNVENLALAYYDEATHEWVKLECKVNIANKQITAEITHYTVFALVTIPKPAAFTIGSLDILPTSAVAGETVTISTVVTNVGGSDGFYTAVLQINGIKEGEQSFTLTAGASRTVSFDIVKENVGTYDVDLNGLSGSFTITAIPTQEATSTPKPTSSPTLEPTTPPTPTAPIAEPASSINWGLIAGLVVGGIAIIWLLLYLILWKVRSD